MLSARHCAKCFVRTGSSLPYCIALPVSEKNGIKKGSRHTASKWQSWHLGTWPWNVHSADEAAVSLY